MTALALVYALLAAPPAPPVAPASVAPATVAPATVARPTLQAAPPADGVIVAGAITRGDLEAVVAAGAQRFIASLQVVPVMDGRRFRGFQLAGVRPDSPLAGSENVRVGDVVVAVNGLPVERPDQFMKAWGGLKKAERIDVKLLRGAQPLVYRWTVSP
ncbi:MAG: hypothetical protein H6706_18110 [Myxococcales bacterium]|nr:hypothetical protein [Myxococcales bacterium]